ncbi:AMIN domain-containing protein [Corynebacterium sp. YIM 101645]|uniref:AMIN domain-containing protein n=1 Tax=Corynebacterium lemuris TaxID=1859292 RepID=A0ABT2FVV7_9CORY|nr:AMIN domain-containing protein [Corynebacterium lemuris]MCS5478099.1 AMIN domain-containing protein [Corynebacterium lemuris]
MRHHTRARTTRQLLAALFAASLTLSACTDGGTSPDSTGNGPEPPGTTTTMAAAANHMGSPDLSEKRQDPSMGTQVEITDIRLGRHADFDRVVLDLRGEGTPGWTARFNTDPVQDGSGLPIEYEGATSLELSVSGLAMPGEDYQPIDTVPGAGGVVTEVIPGGWFEGMSNVVIGLPEERPYSIQMIQNPPRLVVDILHQTAPPATSHLGAPDRSDKRQDPSTGAQVDITNVRVGRHADFDRVVLDLSGEGTPGWISRFNADPVQDGSGLPIEYEGATSLELAVTGLVMPGEDYQPIGTVPGAGGVVTEVIPGGWFEGMNYVVIGLTGERPYSVQLLENPPRLVVDILHQPATPTPTTTPPATSHLGSPDTSPKQQDAEAGLMKVTNVRVGRHADFDRVVLDLTGDGSPGWRADFNTDPRQDGSGFPVEFQGETSIELWLDNLEMPGDDYLPIGTVNGAGGVVTEVVAGTWFEGQSQFVIGLPGERPYSVQLIENPPRLVVDILHQPGAPTTQYLGNPDLNDKSADSGAPHRRAVTNVRIGTHDGFDRVVFDTVGEGRVGWYTSFTTDPVTPEFGEPVEYEGDVALDIHLTGVYLPSEIGEDYPPIGTVSGTGGVVVEVVDSLTFHQQSQFIIGLPEELPYSVQILENPQRVVIDILHE